MIFVATNHKNSGPDATDDSLWPKNALRRAHACFLALDFGVRPKTPLLHPQNKSTSMVAAGRLWELGFGSGGGIHTEYTSN
jgi:hypothetical protein